MKAQTPGHIHRLATEHSWLITTIGNVDILTRDHVLVRVRYASNGRLVHVSRHAPNGLAEHPERGKQTCVRQWLTERS